MFKNAFKVFNCKIYITQLDGHLPCLNIIKKIIFKITLESGARNNVAKITFSKYGESIVIISPYFNVLISFIKHKT